MIGELDRADIEQLLVGSRIARLAIHPLPGDDHPLLVPIPCFYEDGSLYVLSGPGQKIDAMRANPHVTIEVDRFRTTDDWESVVAQARYLELESGDNRDHAITFIEERTGERMVIGENSIVFRIILISASGRFERPE